MLRDEILSCINAIELPPWERADAILNLPEMVEMREKSKAYDKLMEEWFTHEKDYEDVRDMIAEWKEKAEKWDALYNDMSRVLIDDRKHLDLLMDGLMVREKCSFCVNGRVNAHKKKAYTADYYEGSYECRDCGDTGYITRPATVQEVREFIYESFMAESNWKSETDYETWILKSGATLFMKEKE